MGAWIGDNDRYGYVIIEIVSGKPEQTPVSYPNCSRGFYMEMETISTTEARKWLGCTSQTVRNLIKEEKLGSVQLEKERGQKDVI